ncbi:MAG: segregation/condensation protein A [Candidatus Marinimicrobia bacterium]|jgi:segregation and condensation protein A|nr:segregation/condensation protein A [Candidatus Neomarinimicrobiota bacterium]|tara:strand:+ start:259 stop:975 length:717 start_codon:yes stop_codon:yes gene_type:complete
MHKVEIDQFQGPLDLLLYFIRRDEIDINDIPIAKITAEYLQIVEDMKSMNLSVAGEFILMAATLMRIKSKMLLPRPDLDDLGEPIDPRTELVQQLIEYKKYKDIADNLSEKWEALSYQHERSLTQSIDDIEEEINYLKEISVFELAKHFKEVMDRAPEINPYEVDLNTLDLSDKKQFILSSFDGRGILSFEHLLKSCKSKLEVVITFIALLDLVQQFKIAVFQSSLFEDIEIHLLSKN